MRIAVLGPLEVTNDDGRPIAVPGGKERLLLAVLAREAPGVVSTDRLAEALWNGNPPVSAHKSLQSHLVRLRSSLEPGRPRGPGEPGQRPALHDVPRHGDRLGRAARRRVRGVAPGHPGRFVANPPDVIEPGRLLVAPTRPTPLEPVDPYVPYTGEGTQSVAATFLDPRTAEVVGEVVVGDTAARLTTGSVWSAAWTTDGARLLLGAEGAAATWTGDQDSHPGGDILVVDTATWEVVERVAIDVVPDDIELDPSGRFLAAVSPISSETQILDADTLDVVDGFTVGLNDRLLDVSLSPGRQPAGGGRASGARCSSSTRRPGTCGSR